jgi:hypothetical protein
MIDELAKANITVMINVSLSILKMLARVTQARILTAQDNFQQHNYVLGKCRRFHIDHDGKKPIAYLTDCEDPSLGGTILLAGPDKMELKRAFLALR